MTPAARVQAAIDVLDTIGNGVPAEKALTSWARRSRFAGSKDRAAVRDHVYDVLRQRASCAVVGRGTTGRALMIGLLARQGAEMDVLFSGTRYAPATLEAEEQPLVQGEIDPLVDIPAWIRPEIERTLGADFPSIAAELAARAPVILRVNLRKLDRDMAIKALLKEGIHTQAHGLASTALVVTEGARKIAQSKAYKDGFVELQDASSQAAVEQLPLVNGMHLLDYCAGGGGKLLAMAARVDGRFFAHDANFGRMSDLPQRAKRAGVSATLLETADVKKQGPYDLVFCDAPCSGSGSWRRDPEGKWRLDQQRFDALLDTQNEILRRASELVAENGTLAYATCSLCHSENIGQINRFLTENPSWSMTYHQQWTPLDGCDGFFLATLEKS